MSDEAIRIAIASGKGGTGKTTLATNLAVVCAQEGHRVTYADCDVEEPNGHLFLTPEPETRDDVSVLVPQLSPQGCSLCGICGTVCEFNAIAVLKSTVLVYPSLCHSCGACVTLCPEHAFHEQPRPIGFIRSGPVRGLSFLGGSLTIGEAQAPPVIRAIKRRLPENEIVIVDAPPGTSCPVVESVRGADYVVLMTEPTPFGLNDLRLAVGMLRELALPFGVVINRSDIGDSLVWDYCRQECVRILLEVPFSREIAQAYACGRLIVDESASYRAHMQIIYHQIRQEVTGVRTGSGQR
ncbi:ATP-binding protein [bacterium]|nr:ATP-binding protein [bacterium]